ncbi:hypothetical protein R6Q57_014958 [Mikania cordata]
MRLCSYWSKNIFYDSGSDYFPKKGAMEYTIVIAETTDSPATLQYLAPYTGAALAEYFIYRLAQKSTSRAGARLDSTRLDSITALIRFALSASTYKGRVLVSVSRHN